MRLVDNYDGARSGNYSSDRRSHHGNNPASGLGLRPTANTGVPLVDAYLWVKRRVSPTASATPPAAPSHPAASQAGEQIPALVDVSLDRVDLV